ncbi:MAG: hypothetical protein LGR52_02990 [Candidatus Thiosymbion ectosymbiont of Robbea hypermnestra]|nr:hypothetical protein [Candidatus Thiosymbion ectosymbiont of Robbea hypermnestra]
MLKDVLQALKMLKQVENPPKEVKDALEFLEQSVQIHAKQNLLDLMTVGDVIGYDELQSSLLEMADFIERMKNRTQ